MARFAWLPRLFAVAALCVVPRLAVAAQPAESILPATTKLFVSTPDVDETRRKFQATQLGELSADPLMAPFIEDLKKQISKKMAAAGNAMGISWDDMEGLYGGEAVIARIQPDPKDKNSFAMAVIVDITGKREKADTLLKKIDAQQKLEGATRREVKIMDGLNGVEYVQKVRPGVPRPEKDYYFIKDNFLVATDWYQTAVGMAKRIGVKDAADSLASVEAFKFTMQRNAEVGAKDNLSHHVRWFIEPFGYMEASRAANRREAKKGPDLLKILQAEGFNAIQGIGGYVFLDTPNDEVLHRTYVYAPADKKAAPGNKFAKAARMLDFPNTKDKLTPQAWTMPELGTYLTWNWKMKDAFGYAETLVDSVAGEPGVFDDMWASLKNDPHGPKIDIFTGLVNHLGERATLLSDVLQPVDERSERMLVAIEVSNPKIVAETVNKFFKGDPTAVRKVFEGQEIWEIQNEQTAADDGPMLSIEGTDFVAADKKGEDEEEGRKKLPNMAVTVFEGHLVVGTHTDYVMDLIKNAKKKGAPSLADLDDFKRVNKRLVELGQGNDSFRYFAKTEESYRATYEMLRVNKLPQAETMFARILNAMLDQDPDDGVRKNEIDGTKLPAYEKITKYLGPTGLFTQSEDNGWWIVGTLQVREPKK
ncbi:hypothetical protein [Anatilimnocola floriformis]|uniref:hypothetical protein n=1 Tax=Anatilimnocola floriformis TaxID=2948575 RepID=UPI0020C1CB1E|nr:hypothetical protein [Anatilimnocola floriformis]